MKQDGGTKLKERQLKGAVLVALCALVIPVILCVYREHYPAVAVIPFGNSSCKDCVAVEVQGKIKGRGIYFIPKGQRLSDLLNLLRFDAASLKSESSNPDPGMPLHDGIKITVVNRKVGGHEVGIGGMSASTRLALGRPVEVNSASLEDLILVPGIGEKTALKIVETRQREGKFRRLEDLMKIKGIKEKRLEKMRPFISVETL
jgi:competence protein ComEA